jgi:hypothetical protein
MIASLTRRARDGRGDLTRWFPTAKVRRTQPARLVRRAAR